MSIASSCLRVLLLEDEPASARLVERQLVEARRPRFRIHHVEALDPALALLERAEFDLVLADLTLPDGAPASTLTWLSALSFQIPVVLLTASDDEALAERALRAGAEAWLRKGVRRDRPLAQLLAKAWRRHPRSRRTAGGSAALRRAPRLRH